MSRSWIYLVLGVCLGGAAGYALTRYSAGEWTRDDPRYPTYYFDSARQSAFDEISAIVRSNAKPLTIDAGPIASGKQIDDSDPTLRLVRELMARHRISKLSYDGQNLLLGYYAWRRWYYYIWGPSSDVSRYRIYHGLRGEWRFAVF